MEDLIKREDAIEVVTKSKLMTAGAMMDCKRRIERLPSAEPERINGHWIDAVIPNDSGGLPVIVCDKCNTFFPLQFGDGHNFCPHCGARMEGSKE
jgi:hypothetical protein